MMKFLGIGSLLMLVVGAAFFFLIKTGHDKAVIQTAALRESAYAEGLKRGQLDTATASNAALVADVRRIAALQVETNERIGAIRLQARQNITEIRSYQAEAIAVTRPAEVEAWANKVTSDLFADIESETMQ